MSGQSIFTFPWNYGVAITKSDTVNLVPPTGVSPLRRCCDGIYVGGTGDIAWVNECDSVVVLKGAIAGHMYPIRAKRVNSTDTSATDLVALYEG